MKKYRLKQWYPTLAISWRTDDRYEYDADRQVMTNISNIKNGLAMPKAKVVKKQELHPDFWELIEEEEPLFITEDGVEVHDNDTLIFVVKDDFKKSQRFALAFKQNKSTMKSFFHESNADEYIWKNKRLFSYNDIEKFQSGGEGTWWNVEAIAKERIKQ